MNKRFSYFFEVFILKGIYNKQNFMNPVAINTSPINPHQLWNIIPKIPTTSPMTILIILSVLPTLHFIALPKKY